MPARIPLDPDLPENFDATPNELRSKAELDAWWDHPFGVSLSDGSIEVRCLNGGAHDRSSWLGLAPGYEEACALAEKTQAEWVRMRERPSIALDEGAQVVRMPQRPDEDMTVLASFSTADEANAYIREHYPRH